MPPLPEILSRRSPSARFDVLIMYEDFGTGRKERSRLRRRGTPGMIWSSGTRCGGWMSAGAETQRNGGAK
jgi:hypothetical protein